MSTEPGVGIEGARPSLWAKVERFALPDGDLGLYEPRSGSYLRVPAARAPLVGRLDGVTTLQALSLEALGFDRPVSISALLGVGEQLSFGTRAGPENRRCPGRSTCLQCPS